jgi:hypothetical protein
VAEEVHGDVTDEEVTDGGVTLVLFTISSGAISTEDRGSINTSNTVNPSGRLSEGGVERGHESSGTGTHTRGISLTDGSS